MPTGSHCPGSMPAWKRTLAALGPEYWSYGFTANRAELEAVCRYSVEQYLAERQVAPEELFHASVLKT